MAQMSELEFKASVNAAKDDAVRNQGKFVRDSEEFHRRYVGDKYGNEVKGQSQVVSSDVADVVESYMTSMAEVFLSDSDEVMRFEQKTVTKLGALEVKQKNAYVNSIIRQQEDSFTVLHGWIKDALIQKLGVVKAEYVEEEKNEKIQLDGLSLEEAVAVLSTVEEEDIIGIDESDPEDVFIEFQDNRVIKDIRIRGIPTEDFLISRDAVTKDTAELVGDVTLMTKGELIALGYEEAEIKELPSKDNTDDESNSNLKSLRRQDEGGLNNQSDILGWPSQKVEVFDLYILIDFDGDGITERRRVIMAGGEILDNDQFDMVPYGIKSAILMPHKVIGRSLAEVTLQTQRIKTSLYRQILNNIYRVNNPRFAFNPKKTNSEDVYSQRLSGGIRTTAENPQTAVVPVVVPYIGSQALEVVNYVDSVSAKSTGEQLANQGLESQDLYKETATRTKAVKDAREAKVKLNARVFAETGWRQLYGVVVWLTTRFHNDSREIMINEEPFKINPKIWRSEDNLISNVGLAAGDDEDTVQNMGIVATIQNNMRQRGSVMVDEKKEFNAVDKMLNGMNVRNTRLYFNDPEKPEQLLQAQNEQLTSQNEQLMQALEQSTNPLVQPELIKAETGKLREINKSQIENRKLDQGDEKLAQDQQQFAVNTELEYTKVEEEHNTDIAGQGQGN